MEKILDLRGKWQLKGEGLSHCEVYLPGTLDTNQVGHKDTPELATRFTRRIPGREAPGTAEK